MPSVGVPLETLLEIGVIFGHVSDHTGQLLLILRAGRLPHVLRQTVLGILRLDASLKHRVAHLHDILLHVVVALLNAFCSGCLQVLER